MIKVEHIETWGFEHAIRGMRNPLNSWDRIDSKFKIDNFIGKNDLELMHKLYLGGPVHRKFMRQLFVSLDITAPLYWWKEFDTYKVGTTANSCSTMHKIHSEEITLDDFSTEKLTEESIKTLQALIDVIEANRQLFNETKNKDYWWQIIQLLPSSFNQKRTITMDYENALNMIQWRHNHKLDEWREFIEELKDLPLMKNITGNFEGLLTEEK